MRGALFVILLAVASCNCNPKLSDVCAICPGACADGVCRCTSDADCAKHYQCFSGTCLCADATCLPADDGGATGGGAAMGGGSGGGDAGCLEGGCGGGGAIPDSGTGGGMAAGGGSAMGGGSGGSGGGDTVDAGCGTGTKDCNGACVPDSTCCNCCYACDAGTGTSCDETQLEGPADGGDCPTGFSHTSDCAPCWDCRTSNAYCPNAGCCGNWAITGVVNSGCTCYGCQGFAFDHDQNTSCQLAQFYSHDGGPPEPDGGLRFSPCIWPQPGETSFCGYYPDNFCTCFLNHCGGACAL
jgi:hypothetical protein